MPRITPRPYLAAALFCERVLQEQDGVLSAIRIVDTLKVHHIDEKTGQQGERRRSASQVSGVYILLMFKSGEYEGTGKVTFKVRSPSGKELSPVIDINIELKGRQFGANLIIDAGLPFTEPGVYWFDVYFAGELLTRMPLSVVESEPTTATEAPSEPAKRARRRKGHK